LTAEGLDGLLATAAVDPAVPELRPDYVALLVAAVNVPGGPSDDVSDGWLRQAEGAAIGRLAGSPPEERPHVALWREAFRALGAKPQRTRNSLEALLRRVPDGLPWINRLSDLYNALSVLHEVPVVEHAQHGEVVWADDAGVTCCRWNWWQCRRTQLTPATTRALFIIDALGPDALAKASASGDDLEARLRALDPAVATARRLLTAPRTTKEPRDD